MVLCHDVTAITLQPLFPHSCITILPKMPSPSYPRAAVEEGIEVRAFSEKCRGTSQREKMRQCLSTNARHSSKNALSLNPRAAVEKGIEVRAFLKNPKMPGHESERKNA
jgi:hypothetical protein